jgi:hypothetical protein
MLAQVCVDLAQKSLRILTSTKPFIAQGHDSYIMTQGPTGGPGWLDPYMIGIYQLGVSNDLSNGVENVLSHCRTTSRPAQHGTEPLCICLDNAPHILRAYDDGLHW